MMKRLSLLFALLLIAHLASAMPDDSNNDKTIIWQRTPISVTLSVGKERLLSFPTRLRFGYSSHRLPSTTLRVQNNHHTLYLLAKKPFPQQRVDVQLQSGAVILLDLNAVNAATDNRPIDVIVSDSELNTHTAATIPASHRLSTITLTRYALQQLYAPQRLLKPSRAIHRFPMQTHHIVPLVTDTTLLAMPLASWRGLGYYVTAVTLKNKLPQPLLIQPQQLCGTWQTVSFYPRRQLQAQGASHLEDSTTAFLVSTTPFDTSLHHCTWQNRSHDTHGEAQ